MQIYKSMRICTNMCTLCLGVQMDVYLQYKTKHKILQTKNQYRFNTPVYTNIHIKRRKKKQNNKKSHVQGSGQSFSVINLTINTYKNKQIRHTQQKLLYPPTGIHIQGKNHSKK